MNSKRDTAAFTLQDESIWLSSVLAFCLVALSFSWQGNVGFSLWDEGFLWYGAQRVMLGEVPVRDFMAYNPGRYYWAAALMSLWGDNGIMALRGAVAIFQWMGLFAGVWLVSKNQKKQSLVYLFLSGITLLVWMFPRHKLFDISLSMLLVWALTLLVEKPSNRRYFYAGLVAGMAAVFGRNHGLYAAVGSIGVIFWLNLEELKISCLAKKISIWTAGVITGFMPILLMMLFVPGFASAFWEGLIFLFGRGSTNFPLPVPWPWRVDFSSLSFSESSRGLLVGIFFIATAASAILSVIWVIWRKLQGRHVSSALVASSFLAMPYAHYAYSRADISHLAQGIFPCLLVWLILFDARTGKCRWLAASALCAASVWVMLASQPGWRCFTGKQCVNVEISSNGLVVDPGVASDIGLLRRLANEYAADGRSFIATPFWPGAYALLGRKSPMWAIYALWPHDETFQKREIDRIKAASPGFALILEQNVDGRDELRFRNAYPLVYRYIEEHFSYRPEHSSATYRVYVQ